MDLSIKLENYSFVLLFKFIVYWNRCFDIDINSFNSLFNVIINLYLLINVCSDMLNYIMYSSSESEGFISNNFHLIFMKVFFNASLMNNYLLIKMSNVN